MKSLKLPSMLVILILSSTAAAASPLYSWTTKDGTPTYSPDPPPDGVSYEIVGPDLKPLSGQPITETANQPMQNASAPPNAVASDNLVMTPAPVGNATAAPSAPRAKWKPVIYADDPNPNLKPELSAATPEPKADSLQLNQQGTQLSKECYQFRQKLILLESQFANALTAQQMDDAIVRLNVFRTQNKGYCGL